MSLGRKYVMHLIFLLLLSLSIPGCAAPISTQEEVIPETPAVSTSTPSPRANFTLARSDVERELDPQVSQDDLSELTRENSAFAFDLYQAIREGSGNLFFSPFSVSSALSMIFAGARNETERQMAQTLHFTLPQEGLHPAFNALTLRLDPPTSGDTGDGDFQLDVANSLWGQDGFEIRMEFLDLIAENYGAGLRLVDFIDEENRELARLAINQWVSDQTGGKIEELIPEDTFTDLTRLVLANAIYFNAEWEKPFLNGTRDADFTLLDGSQKSVPMMSRRANTRYAEGSGYQAVEIPYKGGSAAMIVILPELGGFESVEGSWGPDLVEEIDRALASTDVKLYLPKFEYESSFKLSDTLAGMGMPDAFDTDRADFTGIIVNPSPRLFIKHVLHKAFIAVDEIGTEAAASTAIIAEIESEPVEVRVDRPFLFFIVDRQSSTILFIGRVLDPAG